MPTEENFERWRQQAKHSEVVIAAAFSAHDAGLHPFPPKEDGTKKPDAHSWTELQTNRIDRADISDKFAFRSGLGIFTGHTFTESGEIDIGLECLEFDCAETFERFLQDAQEDADLMSIVNRVRNGFEERTPGGGIHWLYKCEIVEGNQKLAQRPKREEEVRKLQDGTPDPKDRSPKPLIETRGPGGYLVTHPSQGPVHRTGKPYMLLRGGFPEIVTITAIERERLFEHARSYDQMPDQKPPEKKEPRQQRRQRERKEEKQKQSRQRRKTFSRRETNYGMLPGEDFNRRGIWSEILEPHGWCQNGGSGETTYWLRPGASQGEKDATTNHGGSDLLYVFSTSTNLPTERGLTKFETFALLNHPDGKGGADFSAAAAALRALGYGTEDTRTIVKLLDGNLNRHADDTIRALERWNDPPRLFINPNGDLVRVRDDDLAGAVIQPLSDDALRYEVGRVCRFLRPKPKGKGKHAEEGVEVPPPIDLVRNIRARPDLPFPELMHVVTAPVFGARSLASLRLESGYLPEAKLWIALPDDFTIDFDSLRAPSVEAVANAVNLFETLLADFPFVSQADRAHAIALLLLPFGRSLIDGPTPMHGIEASTPGSGKSLLMQVITSLVTGPGGVSTMAEGEDDAEWRKKITTKVMAGHQYAAIGNLQRPLAFGSLAEALTTRMWEDRELGRNRSIRLPIQLIWAYTANNPVLSDELARRTIRIRLDPKTDRPFERTEFSLALPAWSDDHRSELIAAALTLWAAWIAAGCPSGRAHMGSFDAWAEVMGGVLGVAKIPGFLGNQREFYEAADLEGQQWRILVTSWWDAYGSDAVTASELLELVLEHDLFTFKSDRPRAIRTEFGIMLAKQRDRHYEEFRIHAAGTNRSGSATYRLIESQGRTKARTRPKGGAGFNFHGNMRDFAASA
jgi:hypothetical protein